MAGWWAETFANIGARLQPVRASLSGQQPAVGGLAVTLQRVRAAFTGVQQQTGVLTATLQPVRAALSGAMVPQGSVAATLRGLQFAGIGSQTQAGTLAATLPRLSALLAGIPIQTGAITASLQRLSVSMSGEQPFTGTTAATLQRLTASLSGVMQPEGALGAVLQRLSFAGSVTPVGTIGAELKPATAALNGAQAQQGTLAAQLTAARATLAGGQGFTGTIAAQARPLVAALAGAQPYTGSLVAQARPLSVAFSGGQTYTGTLAATLRASTAAFAGEWTDVITAVEFDAVGAGGSGSNPSWSHTATAGAYVIVRYATFGATVPTGCTYGGVAMVKTMQQTLSTGGVVTQWELSNVAGGVKTVAISGGATGKANSVSYLNVADVYHRVAHSGWGLNSPSLSHTFNSEGEAGDMLGHAFGSYNFTLSSRTGGTERSFQNGGASVAGLSIRDAEDSAAFAASASGSNGGFAGFGSILVPEAVTGRVILNAPGSGYASTKSTGGSIQVYAEAGDCILLDLVGDADEAAARTVTLNTNARMPLVKIMRYNNASGQKTVRRYIGFASVTGEQTIAVSGATSGDLTLNAVSYSNVDSVGTTTTAYGAANGAGSHTVSCSTGELIAQSFGATQANPVWVPTGGVSVFSFGQGSASTGTLTSPLAISISNGSTTFGVQASGTGNWASVANVLKPPSGAVRFSGIGAGDVDPTLTWQHFCPTTGETVLAFVDVYNGSVTGMTYGGNAMTYVGDMWANNTSGSQSRLYVYKYENAPQGAATITVSGSHSNSYGNSVSYAGVTTVGTPTTAFGNSATPSQSVTIGSNSRIVQAFGTRSYVMDPTGGGTPRALGVGGALAGGVLISDTTESVTFSASNTATNWAGIAVPLS